MLAKNKCQGQSTTLSFRDNATLGNICTLNEPQEISLQTRTAMDSPKNHKVMVRQAAIADLDAVAVFFDQYRQFQGFASDLAAGRQFLYERFTHAESVVFVATLDNAPVGFAQLYPIFSSTALARVFILNDLFVSEQGRRHGVARALLKAVETYAWTLNASSVRLNVKQNNSSAQTLYEESGWVRDQDFYMFQRFAPKS